ncbi:phage tail protein [Microbacterium lacus]|uniref:phage tail protein n=1 Tax=Microbacterium lacus TaxID=415217 RepID=UPI000C2BBB5B|nr:hypothetical protein [Microbacterium lacus]
MAFSPGRNVGRVSIRVVPDTTKFRAELKRDLDRFARTTTMKIRVDGVRLDNREIRASIERQMQEFKGLDLQAKVEVIVDKARLKKTALRKSIQAQFDDFEDIRVNIAAQIQNVERFEKEVRDMVQRANRNKVSIGVAAHTAAAAAQMRYVSRPRFVDLFVRVNKTSVAAALTTLAALSGARLSWKWIDDLAQKMGDLDKNLPSLLGWTTGITSLVAALFGATSGLVGIGGGLFSILPALLVAPGLLINALGSLTVLIVALKNAGSELSVLKDDMSELGDIINETFWTRARQPIIDLVQGLMPQLRVAFRDLAEGMGDFTAAMSQAFGEELANGRLASIFSGIAEGWRILGSGASGFAGALVSLSQIAATYTPRLASWFVRQANTFDAWLESIANDGRLGDWMETAIDSMYDLWDATTGVAGVLTGIWRASEAAGGGGLKGFAELMQDWKRVTNGAEFQRGLTAIFRGSSVAMSAFGDAIRAIGRLVADLDKQFESFIGSAGIFLGGLVGASANALNSPVVGKGLQEFSDGLITALDRITPSLQPIADTFGNFLGLLGELASTVLPAAAGVLADLMPAIDGLIQAVKPVLEPLATALTSISEVLGPAISGLVETLTPALQESFNSLADGLVSMAPSLASLVDSVGPSLAAALEGFNAMLGPYLSFFSGWLNLLAGASEALSNLSFLWDDNQLKTVTDGIIERGGWIGDVFTWANEFDVWFDSLVGRSGAVGSESGQAFVDGLNERIRTNDFNPLDDFDPKIGEFETNGSSAGGGFSRGLTQGISGGMAAAIEAARSGGSAGMGGFGSGAGSGQPGALSPFQSLQAAIGGVFAGASGWLVNAGSSIMGGLLAGLRSAYESVKSFVSGIATWIVANKGPISYDKRLLIPAGRSMMQGLNAGLRSGFVEVQANVRGIADNIAGQFGTASGNQSRDSAAGRPINVTMPLLPGETPEEQRDNLVRTLRNV